MARHRHAPIVFVALLVGVCIPLSKCLLGDEVAQLNGLQIQLDNNLLAIDNSLQAFNQKIFDKFTTPPPTTTQPPTTTTTTTTTTPPPTTTTTTTPAPTTTTPGYNAYSAPINNGGGYGGYAGGNGYGNGGAYNNGGGYTSKSHPPPPYGYPTGTMSARGLGISLLSLITAPLTILAALTFPIIAKLALTIGGIWYLVTTFIPSATSWFSLASLTGGGLSSLFSARQAEGQHLGLNWQRVGEYASDLGSKSVEYLSVSTTSDCQYRGLCETAFFLATNVPQAAGYFQSLTSAVLINSNSPYAAAWLNGSMKKDCSLIYFACGESPYQRVVDAFRPAGPPSTHETHTHIVEEPVVVAVADEAPASVSASVPVSAHPMPVAGDSAKSH